ncbi:hypothetical protein TRFO_07832 [Tritrichomonas foetus]|uniref:Uncharacterized protein n=1 Tax=Tritrichomonas foetus TaxID=1144522 RepID=A0A1J4JNV9_9EUKA|nr:hypothetical protein TRFO_07832 [Tritrichomonas foetus]|eukprot:OHT00831.1 hypothetical protein TRFO_07832 [Tritrichomonas foetus]
MHGSRSSKKNSSVRDLHWGLFKDEGSNLPTSPVFKAFCQVNYETFAHSDGGHVTIWTPKNVLTTFNLKAISLHYVKSVNHIIATVQRKAELFFISMRSPYQITQHPFLFSNKVITVMHFFEKSSILVTAGQGLMFTKVIVPTMFKMSAPIPEMLKFEKITEIYQDSYFVNVHSPVFVESREIVIVYFDNAVKIHLLDGTCIQQFENLTMSPITCLSFYEPKNWLVVGDQEGYTSILHFQCANPFIHGAHPETSGFIYSYRPETCHLLLSMVFENDFLVTIGLNHQITLYSLTAEKQIQFLRFNLNPQSVFYAEPNFFIFSEREIESYHLNLFSKHFANLTADCFLLKRCPSIKNAARLLCHSTDSIVSLFSPKTAKLLYGIRAVQYQYDVQNVIYPRDVLYDGIKIKPTKPCDDLAFFRMGKDTILHIDFQESSDVRKKYQKQELFTSTTFMDTKYLKYQIGESPTQNPFVSFLRIETPTYSNCILGICKSGLCYIYSLETKKMIDKFELGFGSIMCAAYSSVHNYVIFSCMDHTIVYNLETKKILSNTEHTFYRSLLVVSERTLACGCANGMLEIRNFPQMTVQSSSQKHEVYHSDQGYRRDLSKEYESYEMIMDVNFSITTIDYCVPRNALLTLSPNGEIFIWSLRAFPICHILLEIAPTAACFLNGYGTIVFCSLKTLFTIDWRYIFTEKIDKEKNELDHFDQRDDKFDLVKFTQNKLDHGEKLDNIMKQKQTPRSKFKRIRDDEQSLSLSGSISMTPSIMNFSPFRVRRVLGYNTITFFENLVVEENEIPKCHFFKRPIIQEQEQEAPKKRKLKGFVQLMSLPEPTINKSPAPNSASNSNQNSIKVSINSNQQQNNIKVSVNSNQPQNSVGKYEKSSEIKVTRMKRECEMNKSMPSIKYSSKPKSSKVSKTTTIRGFSGTPRRSNNTSKSKPKKMMKPSVNTPKISKMGSTKRKSSKKKKKSSQNIDDSITNQERINQLIDNHSKSMGLSKNDINEFKLSNNSNNINTTLDLDKNNSQRTNEINDFLRELNERKLNNEDITTNADENQICSSQYKEVSYTDTDGNEEIYLFDRRALEMKHVKNINVASQTMSEEVEEVAILDDYRSNSPINENLDKNSDYLDENDENPNNIGKSKDIILFNNNDEFTESPLLYMSKINENNSLYMNHSDDQNDNYCLNNDSNQQMNDLINNRYPNNTDDEITNLDKIHQLDPNKKIPSFSPVITCFKNNVAMPLMSQLPTFGKDAPWHLLGSISNRQYLHEIQEPQSIFMNRARRFSSNKMNSDIYIDQHQYNPLLYVQNLEQDFCEPYVIEDLTDPRMGLVTDSKMKYLKLPEPPTSPRNTDELTKRIYPPQSTTVTGFIDI